MGEVAGARATARKAYLDALLARLDRARDLLVAGLGANARYLPHLSVPVPYVALCDAMGSAIPLALGMALGRPDRRVVVLEGDGSLLMNLGTLGTVGAARPANLTTLVFRNRRYESSGGQALPRVAIDFGAVARASGFALAEDIGDTSAFGPAFARARNAGGPALLVLETTFDPDEPIPPYSERPDEIRVNFTRALGQPAPADQGTAGRSRRTPPGRPTGPATPD
jgi:thiamine pyrophosphate-dependent acetolactate synthase large subunit-like protein